MASMCKRIYFAFIDDLCSFRRVYDFNCFCNFFNYLNMATKYIKTKYKKIIVFSELHVHSDFKNFDPVSAGFIDFYTDENDNVKCRCYGSSFSLQLRSEPEEDTLLANMQIASLMF